MMSNSLLDILQHHWGYKEFRSLQEDIIKSVLEGHDTLGLMPTGGGKSITFQVAGLAMEGLTIVVTPLISLMKDQVDNLRSRHIKAVALHSGMSRREKTMAWEKIVNGGAKFMYISPERIASRQFINDLRSLRICQIVVDEAHCISQWGYDFRPAYLNIRELRRIAPDAPVLALTATATPLVADDICRQLEFKNELRFAKSFSRENLNYIVRTSDTKIHDLYHILSHTQGSAIIYVRSRKRTRDIADYLTEAGIDATYYHAALDNDLKEERQNRWKLGAIRVMVATNAFGMGIDKADVRTVIHYDLPPSLEEYYQEAGRAGRDGKTSYAVVLSSSRDKAKLNRKITIAYPPRDFIKKVYELACIYLRLEVGEGYDSLYEFDIDRFCNIFKLNPEFTLSALHILSQSGYMEYVEDARRQSRVMITINREQLYSLPNHSKNAESVLRTLLRTYPGLFMDYIFISESKIARVLQLEENEVYEALLELNKMDVTHYVPKSHIPYIYMPTSREETRYISIPKSVYEDRKNILRKRTEAMIDYVFNGQGCRVKRMLNYFGEKGKDCGKCDVCRAKRASKSSDVNKDAALAERIVTTINNTPMGISLPILARKVADEEAKVAEIADYLCAEGYIRFDNDVYKSL